MASSTAARVDSAMPTESATPFSTTETVVLETQARRATSAIVTRLDCLTAAG